MLTCQMRPVDIDLTNKESLCIAIFCGVRMSYALGNDRWVDPLEPCGNSDYHGTKSSSQNSFMAFTTFGKSIRLYNPSPSLRIGLLYR